ncbi:hypothetical protein EJ02DRAFT_386174 [Clathrospora elynae]|uniref:Zn(2)-C6 fungal-type domain-containing protein n=1 Tax=Clathrospora elynae TaxID=706981 RepID=A0A6A5SCE7_9PLEO|nr:hypothetical protein EJ02DRAFT_386174 [Clathrospora elynae]
MVYRGRPSAACFLCRERRIKCDKKSPRCSQCARMHVKCPGYRDALDQKFRDETKSVVKRAERIYKKSDLGDGGQQEPIRHDLVDLTANVIQFESTPPSMSHIFTLTPSMVDIAITNFMSSYIPGSHYDYLPWMYGLASQESALSSTVQATAMAYLSQELCQSDLMGIARRTYAKALRETNEALAHPSTASSNSTLVSVLLLGLFESLIWTHTGTPECWTTHTRGAFAIIKLRGLQQFETPVGQQLFAQVANKVCINSLQHKSRLPMGLEDLIERALQYKPDSPPYQLIRLTSKVSNLIADIYASTKSASKAVQMLCQLDEEYKQFAKYLPLNWRYHKSTLERPEELVYGNTGHWYPGHRALQLWNSYRMTRILLNEVVHALADDAPTDSKAQFRRQAIDNIEEMATEICTSISYFVGCSNLELHRSEAAFMAPALVTSRALAASLLWPLSAVRGASLASKDIRAYSVKGLRYLGTVSRAPQAAEVASQGPDFDALQDGLHMIYVS